MAKGRKLGRLYVGVDVGGTKILAALIKSSGKIVATRRCSTPRGTRPEETAAALTGLIGDLLDENGVKPSRLRAIGLAVPGIVDPVEGRVLVAPNMNLGGFHIVPPVEEAFRVPVAIGNDVNLGTLGEQWLGAAALADSAVGIFVGTGIGGGIIVDGKLLTGFRGAAAEVGHMRMQLNGPLCGCGNRGCLEALASRTAIERDIRQAVAAGRKTVLTEMTKGNLDLVRSNLLRRALQEGDALVTEVMTQASETLGEACLTIRHLLDPEVIMLGGGVVEACKFFILPIVQRAVAADPLAGAVAGGKVVVSALGDNAVALGAVALAQQYLGKDPFRKVRRSLQQYPVISQLTEQAVTIDGATFEAGAYIRVDGKIVPRCTAPECVDAGRPELIDTPELKMACKGVPSILLIGTNPQSAETLSESGEEYLRNKGITYELSSPREAVDTYNAIKGRKALLLHV